MGPFYFLGAQSIMLLLCIDIDWFWSATICVKYCSNIFQNDRIAEDGDVALVEASYS
jgi:hypothetical protein